MTTINDEDREAVKKLMEDAEIMAHASMRQSGTISPTLFIHGAEGKAVFSPDEFGDEVSKELFVQKARLVCVAHGANAAVFLTEAWVRRAKNLGDALDTSIRPSESPDREEMVVIMGETRQGHFQKMLPIERTADGRFMGFGASPELAFDNIQGRFAQFVPPIVPDEKGRAKAKEVLEAFGIEREDMEKQHKHRGHGRARF